MKALQNIVAVIILVGITMALTIAAALWISGFIAGKTSIHRVDINEYSPAVLSGIDDAVLITMKNKGSAPISLEKIFFNQEPFEHYSNCLRGYIVKVDDNSYSVEVTTSATAPLGIKYSLSPQIASYYGGSSVDGIIVNKTYSKARISLIEKIVSTKVQGAAILYEADIFNEYSVTKYKNQWFGLEIGYLYNGSLFVYYKYSGVGIAGWKTVFLRRITSFNPFIPHTYDFNIEYDNNAYKLKVTYIIDGLDIGSFYPAMNYTYIYMSYAGRLYTGSSIKLLVDDHLIYIHGPENDYRQEITFEKTAPTWIILGQGVAAYVHPSLQDARLEQIYIRPGETARFYVYLDATKVAHGLKFLLRIIDSEGYTIFRTSIFHKMFFKAPLTREQGCRDLEFFLKD
ncbi:MAG: hypothetical protein GXO43_07740 [Crenarchaeota archaeon]|nr:hypothetical protein [Thermoproteota archaeon]